MKRQDVQVNKIVGIDEYGSFIMVETLHWNGVCYMALEPMTQEQVDEINDSTDWEEEFEYLWKEAVKNGDTTDSLKDFAKELKKLILMDSPTAYSDNVSVDRDSEKIIEKYVGHFDYLNCTACGTRKWQDHTFSVVLDQDLYDRCLAHDLSLVKE